MPTNSIGARPHEIDPRRWERCLRDAAAGLKARGIFDSHRRYWHLKRRAAERLFHAH